MKKIFLTLLILLFPLISAHAEVPEILGTIHSDTTHTQFGAQIISLGDHNNDGYNEIITWGYNKRTYLFQGGYPIDTIADFIFDSVSFALDNVGDVNGDSYEDFVVRGFGPYRVKLNLYYGGPSMDTVRDLWFGADSLTGGGPTVVGGDINQNGTDELIGTGVSDQGVIVFFELGTDSDSIPDFKIRPPNFTHYIDYDGFGEGMIAGDFNGDGKRDIGVSMRPLNGYRGEIWFYWSSSNFDTIPDFMIPRPGLYIEGATYFGSENLEYLGDFNDDGWDDFYASSGLAVYDTLGFVFFGGPAIDTIPDIILVNPGFKACLGGDLNNDGYYDLITSLALPWVTGGFIKIYYGGPEADSIPDYVIGNSEFPGAQEYFGNDVARIGDFNNDGIDDFAFSAVGSGLRGEIYILAGWDDATDVPYEYEPTLPHGFNLYQNYPNPFNNTTTISFEIPNKENVTLNVYNVLGEEVITLINKDLSAGMYHIEWDGTDNKGNVISSGVYLYRLSSFSFTQEMKMILVK